MQGGATRGGQKEGFKQCSQRSDAKNLKRDNHINKQCQQKDRAHKVILAWRKHQNRRMDKFAWLKL